MMMMKSPTVLVTCMLLLSSLTVLAYENAFSPDKCCFVFFPKPVPKNKVVSFTYTDKLCSMEGVLFKMIHGAELCADPNMLWVQKVIKAKEKMQNAKVNNSSSVQSD